MERIGGAENRAERRWVCHRSSTAFSLQLTAWRSSLMPQGHARLKALSTDAVAQHRKMQSNRTARLTAARKGILRVVPSVASAAEFDHVVQGGRAARRVRGVAVAVVRPMWLASQHPHVLRVPPPRDRPWPAARRRHGCHTRVIHFVYWRVDHAGVCQALALQPVPAVPAPAPVRHDPAVPSWSRVAVVQRVLTRPQRCVQYILVELRVVTRRDDRVLQLVVLVRAHVHPAREHSSIAAGRRSPPAL